MKKLNLISCSIFVFCFSFYIFSFFRSFDPDLWGHLKLGEFIIKHSTIPFTDIYSFVQTKDLWINHEWLIDPLFYLLLQLNASGFFLLLFKSIIYSLAILIPWIYISRTSNYNFFNLLIYIPIILAFSYGTAIRAQMFTYLFFALTLLILETDHLKGKLSYIGLPIMFVIWVNFHGGVFAGLALVYIYAFYHIICNVFIKNKEEKANNKLSEHLKILVIPIILSCVLIINPYTYHYYPFIIDALLMKRHLIEEWGSIFSTLGNFTYLNILVLITSIFVILNLRYINKDKCFQIILIVIMMLMAMNHVRHIPFFAITCAFYLPDLITSLMEKEKFDFAQIKTDNPVIPIIIIITSFILLFFTFTKDKTFDYQLEVSLNTTKQYVGFPVDAIRFIKENNLHGNMMTNLNWGEFISYQLYPEMLVSFDGRYETIYTNQTIEDNTKFLQAKPGWKKVLEKFDPDMVLISRQDPVIAKMINKSGWPLVFQGVECFLFINPKHVKIINSGTTKE